MITPLDVQKHKFKKGINGYQRDEVDQYLALIADTLEKHINENIMLKEKLDHKDEQLSHFQSIEKTMSETLVVAKQTAEELLENANKTAKNTIDEANFKAQKIKNDADLAVLEVMRQREQMERDLEAFRVRMEAMLKAQLEVVENYSVDIE